MSATLLLLAPLGALAVFWSLYFVACWPNIRFRTPYALAAALQTHFLAGITTQVV